MGGSLELEGGRRTRSSTRGTPSRVADAVTPPPNKKARTSPATTKSGGRARGARKLDVGGEEVDKTPVKAAKAAVEKKTPEPAKANVSKLNSSTRNILISYHFSCRQRKIRRRTRPRRPSQLPEKLRKK